MFALDPETALPGVAAIRRDRAVHYLDADRRLPNADASARHAIFDSAISRASNALRPSADAAARCAGFASRRTAPSRACS